MAPPSAQPKQRGQRSQEKVVLIVEDDPSTTELFQLLLQSETPYQVRSFPSGLEVLSHIQQVQELHPALFLFDYRLPSMNALQLYDQLHTREGLEQVPALIVSAAFPHSAEEVMAERGIRMLRKPFELDALLETIRELIG